MKEQIVDYAKMTGPELIGAYNAMVCLSVVIANCEERQRKPVQKFESLAAGVARCEALASRIRAWKGAEKDDGEKAPRKKREAKQKQEKIPAITKRSKVVALLEKNKGGFVSVEDLVLAAYGKNDATLRGGLANILRGITQDIKEADYELSSEKGKRFGLFSKITT